MRRVLGHYVATSWLLFGIFEAALIGAGSCVAFYYRFYRPGGSVAGLTLFAALLSLGVVGLMHSGGLYRSDSVRDLKHSLWRIALITAPIFALAVWTTSELHRLNVPIYPYRWQWTLALTAAWLFSAISLRLVLLQVYRSGVLTRRVVVVGTSARAAELCGLARECYGRFQVVGYFDSSAYDDATESTALSALTSRLRAAEIVVSSDYGPVPWKLLAQSRVSGVRVTEWLDFYERETNRINIDDLRDDWIALSRGFANSPVGERTRRAKDVVLACVGFVATAPVFLLTALAIKLEDGGSVLYRQERIGLGGRTFELLKFRSMREDAESDGLPAWAVERDCRITLVGKVIRKLRIDELPQFWNVLRGDMTLIGPRPERPYFVRQFSQTIPFYEYRHVVRPGITGWAQVSFRYGASFDDTHRKLSYDLYYVKNRGVLLDTIILLRTIGVVLRGEGAR